MPAFVKTAHDARLWSEAQKIVAREYGSERQLGDRYWALVNGTFHRMRGVQGNPRDDDGDDILPCNLCGGELVPLGTLGKLQHFRCRACGMESSTELTVPQHYAKRTRRGPVRKNPSVDVLNVYERFHGTEPDSVTELSGWYPGELVTIGVGVDVGYDADKVPSTKRGYYVHDFGSGVKIYKRALAGTRADYTWHNFPKDKLVVLGGGIGFTYKDDRGQLHEIKGGRGKKLAVTPDRKTLVFIGPAGVEFIATGGRMRVEDWIYD